MRGPGFVTYLCGAVSFSNFENRTLVFFLQGGVNNSSLA